MKIGFVWHNSYPWDVRLEKIMKACIEHGHKVCLLCLGKEPLPTFENLNGIKVQRVYPPRIVRVRWSAKAAAFPLFFNPIWIACIAGFLRKETPDLLVVRDLPLASLVGLFGRMSRVPVILDMAENYPAALTAYQNALYNPFLFGNGWLPKQYEKISLKMVDHTLVVTDEQVRRLKALGVEASRITVVGNTPETCFFSSQKDPPVHSDQRSNGNGANLLFVGKLDAHRGVELLIRAMPDLLQEFPGLTLTLVGDGTQRAQLERVAGSLGLSASIRLPGWVEFRNIWSYIDKSTVCLIPHLRSEHTDTTLPNKLFDYMALGKPVVASNCEPLERVIRETDCGVTFQSGNVADLQAALRRLLSSPEMRLAKGQNGKKAVQENYNWAVDRKSLLRVIDGLSPERRRE
jgi:glycosyltransferase involved in cell wall biosynthesis